MRNCPKRRLSVRPDNKIQADNKTGGRLPPVLCLWYLRIEKYRCENKCQPYRAICPSCSFAAEPAYDVAGVVGGEKPFPVENGSRKGCDPDQQEYELDYIMQYHASSLFCVQPCALSSISTPSRVMSASPMLSLTIWPITRTSFIAATFSWSAMGTVKSNS